MQTPKEVSSYFEIISPKNKNAMIAANIGDVFYKNASLERDINLTAVLKRKNVIVPEIALIITNFHCSGGMLTRSTLSFAHRT
jgi:hypothetical protein